MVAMICTMGLMSVLTVQMPRFLSHNNQWWMEVVGVILFLIISVLVVCVCVKPRHEASSRNSIPCVPLLPICAIWMDVHLIACLPYTSWLAFLIWSLIGESPNSFCIPFHPINKTCSAPSAPFIGQTTFYPNWIESTLQSKVFLVGDWE